jgi:hypothetical protein
VTNKDPDAGLALYSFEGDKTQEIKEAIRATVDRMEKTGVVFNSQVGRSTPLYCEKSDPGKDPVSSIALGY